MNEAIKLEAVNPCAECREKQGCAVCHREEEGGAERKTITNCLSKNASDIWIISTTKPQNKRNC
jgi:hypothetical protein